MNRVFIASTTFDLNGHLVIDPLGSSDFGTTSRRTNKVATLDGGVAVNDGGFAHGDKDFTIDWRTRDATFEALAVGVVENYATVYVTTRDGCFLATPASYSATDGVSSISLSIHSKVA